MENFQLTPNEKILMDIFWESGETLTSVDLIERMPDKKNYIPIMLKSLIAKGLLMECGTVLYGRRYARAFTPTMTREKYSAKLALQINKRKDVVPDITAALLGEIAVSEKAAVIEEIEELILKIKSELPLEGS